MREILLKHQIENCMHYDKKQLIVLLGEKGLLPSKQEKVKKEIKPKFEKLATIRNNPKPVIIKNVKTGEINAFPSIYKASKFIGRSPSMVQYWDGKVWDNKYEIRLVSPDVYRITTEFLDEHESVVDEDILDTHKRTLDRLVSPDVYGITTEILDEHESVVDEDSPDVYRITTEILDEERRATVRG